MKRIKNTIIGFVDFVKSLDDIEGKLADDRQRFGWSEEYQQEIIGTHGIDAYERFTDPKWPRAARRYKS